MYQIYPEMTLPEREEAFKKLAVKQDSRTYTRSLSQEEMDNEKGKYAQDAIERDKLQKTLKNLQDEYKTKITSMDKLMEEELERIKTGKIEVTGWLWGIADHANNRLLWYNQHGELIDSRDLLPEEKQGRLFIPENAESKLQEVTFQEGDKSNEQPTHTQSGNDNDNNIMDAEYEEVVEDKYKGDYPDKGKQLPPFIDLNSPEAKAYKQRMEDDATAGQEKPAKKKVVTKKAEDKEGTEPKAKATKK